MRGTDSMVERMSRAYWEAGRREGSPFSWEDESEEQRHVVRQRMRAAIAAIRDPTEAMIDAAYDAVPSNDYFAKSWRAAIDAGPQGVRRR